MFEFEVKKQILVFVCSAIKKYYRMFQRQEWALIS
jgi:gluconate kinase